ncbi:MAG: hypothetical protein NT049_03725, partial [Planctomycetota bacterium]|nr:hypothetical protein [Planctomycetota bacterium]
ALRSVDYKVILRKLADLSIAFTKAEVASGLTEAQKGKLNNFLQKMKRLNVIRSGDSKGEYVFIHRMVWLYIWLNSIREGTAKNEAKRGPASA